MKTIEIFGKEGHPEIGKMIYLERSIDVRYDFPIQNRR